MKGLLLYYSNTGNTKLICELLKQKLTNIELSLVSILDYDLSENNQYDIFGFASFTDQLELPNLMKIFINRMKTSTTKYAFILNTYGSISGRTLYDLKQLATKNGYFILDGLSIHVPENYPPMIKKGFAFLNEPSSIELEELKLFINRLATKIDRVKENKISKNDVLFIGLKQKLIPSLPKFISRFELGKMECKKQLCIRCKLCEKGCPVHAIKVENFPVFDHSKCQSCWKCYNLCPQKAIKSSKLGEGYYYSKINEEYKNKILSI
jgi:MinD superfamily P-loop ATPase containing an inserted ferredoxin domain